MLNKTETIEFDDLDFEEFIQQIEESFDIRFGENAFNEVFNVGQFMEVIANKVNATSTNNCSSQIAFYKLRRFTRQILDKDIYPNSEVKDIFPSERKAEFWKLLSKEMEVKLAYLQPPVWFTNFVTVPLLLIIFGSFVLLFFQTLTGILIFITSLVLLKVSMIVSDNYLNNYPCSEINDLVTQILVRNYKKINKGQFDKREVENIIEEMLLDYSGIDKSIFNREVRLFG